MATILEFRASHEEAAQRPRRHKVHSAEIVIFPGIRYERWRDAEGKTDVARGGKQRDVLKLVD